MSDIIIDNQNNKYKTDSDKKSEKQTRIQMLSIDIPIVYINWNLFYF